MNEAARMIDKMIQDYAEEIPTTMIQELGSLRKELMSSYGGDINSLKSELSNIINETLDKHNADMMVIMLTPEEGGTQIGTIMHMKNTPVSGVMSCVMSIPGVMKEVVNTLDEKIPGFRANITVKMMMESLENVKGGGLGDILGKLGDMKS